MSKIIKIGKYLLLITIVVTFTACASTRKNTYYNKRKRSSRVNASQLGRNKYYFSPGYQKKLNKNFRRE